MTRGVGEADQRGMTNLVGIVLLIGMTFVGAIAVVAVGTFALQSVSDQTQDDTAQDSMREMSARLATVSDSSVDDATTFHMEGDVNVSSAKITITAQNSSGSPLSWDRNLGTIVYEQSDGTRLAYQGGGLFRLDNDTAIVVNRPGLDYDGSTIDFSIVNVSRFNSVSQSGEVIARKDVEQSRASARDLRNALQDTWTKENGTVPVDMTVTIESQYADGWERYARDGMTVSPDSITRLDSNEVEFEFHDLGTETSGTGANSTNATAGNGTTGNGTGGSSFDRAMRYDSSRNALQVNQDVGNLTLLTAQIGEPVAVETVIEDEEVRDPMDVVFAIDETGSMTSNDPAGERISVTERFIDSLNASNGDRTGFVQFTTDDRTCFFGTCYSNPVPQYNGTVGYHPVTSNFPSVKSELSTYARGETNITRGIDTATTVHTNVSDPNEERVMIVLTDGENTGWATDNSDTVEAAERAQNQHNITVHVVGLGDNVNRSFLENVATHGGGNYYHADSAGDLEDQFDQIVNDTRTQTVHQINRTRTLLSASQNTTQTIGVSGNDNVNDPDFFAESTGSVSIESDLTNLEPGEYLSFVLELESCRDYELTDVNSTVAGTQYRHAYCKSGGTVSTTINSTNSEHVIFRDGDAVPDDTTLTVDWWHSDPTSFLGPYTNGAGDTFDLSEEEAVIALDVPDVDGQSGYVLLHFEVAELDTTSAPPTPADSSSEVSGGDAPRAPITIGFSEVGIS